MRKSLANRIFDTLADLETALTDALRPYWDNPAQLVQLTAFPWWRHAVQPLVATPRPGHHVNMKSKRYEPMQSLRSREPVRFSVVHGAGCLR
jgi:hypothetical protein